MIGIDLEYINEREVTCTLCERMGVITYPLVEYILAPRGGWSHFIEGGYSAHVTRAAAYSRGILCPDCTESNKYADA